MRRLACDWRANQGDLRIQLSLLMFRLCQDARITRNATAHRLVKVLYKVIVEWTWGIRLPWNTDVAAPLIIHHGTGLVVHAECVLGAGVVLRQNVCLGERAAGAGVPRIGDSVDIGANAVVLGPVTVGARAVVGAGAVVVSDVADSETVVGVPARPLVR